VLILTEMNSPREDGPTNKGCDPVEKSNVVLVAEDDNEIRDLVCTQLELDGFKVICVTNGDQAVSESRSLKPDVIVMDLKMPKMNGIDAIKVLKEDRSTRHIPIIVATVVEEKEDIVKSFEAGAISYISKPYYMPELKARINSVLESKKLYDNLIQSEGKYRLLVENANEAILVIQDEILTFYNPRASQLFDYPENKLSSTPFVEFLHAEDRDEFREYQERALLGRRACPALSFRLLAKDGNFRWVEAKGVPIDWDGKPATLHFITDITARKRAEEEMRFLAFYDCLTGLPNRLMFNEHMNQTLAYAKRNNNLLATLFLDLDHFKRVNDTLGHHLGDMLLNAVGERLIRIIRKSDILARNVEDICNTNIARFGGDEFVLLLTNIKKAQDAAKVARRILYTLSDAFVLDSQKIFITTSIGISLFPADGQDGETLIKNADKAMYHAKKVGRNNYQFYADSDQDSTPERVTLKSDLYKALEDKELLLYYQPQVSIDTRSIIGTEALIRWQHANLGVVPPADIIPLAEESGLIDSVSKWVLQTACKQNLAWREAGLTEMRMSVNLSSLLFKEEKLVDLISELLDESGADPSFLEIELPESSLIQEENAVRALRDLKDLGVRIAADDFGTGYSSLHHLRNIPLDVLKIDRSFIKNIPENDDNAAIVAATIAMAHSLNMEVVAVGVETEAQLEFLRERGCDIIQGYLFSPPLPAYDIIPLLQEEGLEITAC
jgi:diguanylate cyclase (GGDEF)-like protein/PAS domain S-box-containing protein